jgi:hypothetical protein
LPNAGVIFDASGSYLVGVTSGLSGPARGGTVFEVGIGKT